MAGKKLELGRFFDPMHANPVFSVEQAAHKCPGALFSEVKVDGERLLVHKRGAIFTFFSRNCKPVPAKKVCCRLHDICLAIY